MSITPEDLLRSAKEIANNNLEEISQRNAISRGYYWAFHAAKSIVPPDRKDRRLGMHKSYIAQLNEGSPGSFERRLGTRLHSMYGRRLMADYDLEANVSNNDWKLLLEKADELQEILANPPQSPPPSEPATARCRPQLKVVK